jgi:hypothetical protein
VWKGGEWLEIEKGSGSKSWSKQGTENRTGSKSSNKRTRARAGLKVSMTAGAGAK